VRALLEPTFFNYIYQVCSLLEEINFLQGLTTQFLIGLGLSFLAGFVIGLERESKGKPAGISTQCLVIGGSMIFSYISALVDPTSTSRIAASIVTGIGFLGAGLILKSEEDRKVTNLTTAASVWFSCSIGMAFGFGLFIIGIIGIAFAVLVARIPKIQKFGIGHVE
jgi:putative Mg2+ transporter-C (MgtC) family protein